MKRLIIGAVMALAAASHAAAQEDGASAAAVKLAGDYLAAYSTFEPDKMAPFLADDMVFYDPTSSTQTADGGAFIFEGKAAVLKGLGDYAAQYEDFSVSYDVERRYESEGNVVFVAQLSYALETIDGKTFAGTAPIVTVVAVKDGKVVKHTDYYDYKGNAVNFDGAGLQ